jgi:Domain of unknown function (DUF4262)
VTSHLLADYESEIVQNVKDYGCHVTSVFDPDAVAPSFAYSTGFWETVGQPEVIILGLPSPMGPFAINETLRQCQAGLQLLDGQRIEGLFEEFDVTCVARIVDASNLVPEYFNSAIWYRSMRTGRPLDEALQLVWAYEGFFPWDDGAPAELFEDQPLLYSGTLH